MAGTRVLGLVFLILASAGWSSCGNAEDFKPVIERSAHVATELASSISGAGTIDYEAGYSVKTVLDGDKFNLSIYSTVMVPSQNFIYALDSTASQLLKITLPIQETHKEISRIIVGDWSGTSGYRDGVGEQALLDHPKSLTLDDCGNVYVADVRNRVIRKITPRGYVYTVAGKSDSTGHVDGDGRIARFSADFSLTYLPQSCSLLVSDRGNRRLRLIELPPCDKCRLHGPASDLWQLEVVGILVGIMLALILSGGLGTYFLHVWEKQQNAAAASAGGGEDDELLPKRFNGDASIMNSRSVTSVSDTASDEDLEQSAQFCDDEFETGEYMRSPENGSNNCTTPSDEMSCCSVRSSPLFTDP